MRMSVRTWETCGRGDGSGAFHTVIQLLCPVMSRLRGSSPVWFAVCYLTTATMTASSYCYYDYDYCNYYASAGLRATTVTTTNTAAAASTATATATSRAIRCDENILELCRASPS